MKFSTASVLATCLPAISARFVEPAERDNIVLDPKEESFLIELEGGKRAWISEDGKWELRRNGVNFMDITDNQELGTNHIRTSASVTYPKKCSNQDAVNKLADHLSKEEMQTNLEKLTSFYTRYYKSDYGLQSSDWILEKVNEMITEAGAGDSVFVQSFPHAWQQHSVIATIPGQTNTTVIVGAHQDSINLWLPSILSAPGADDDGSGTVTIMEVFRNLLRSKALVQGNATNTLEFHWYSAEEGGLLGSQAIFSKYEKDGRDVKAMLQQDMTGFVSKTVDSGRPESVGVIMDYVDTGLTAFIKTVIEEYCNIPWVETKCGYACSDHASASKAGYPSAFVIESAFEDSDPHIHTTDDNIKYLSFDHMLEHARMTMGLVYELGQYDFSKNDKDELKEEWTDL